VDEVQPDDVVFEDHGVKVLIDPKSLAYIDGTELDFRARKA
jgi:iron-sulfur cluster assembly protein